MDGWMTSSKNPTYLYRKSCMGKNSWDLLALPIALRKRLCFLMCLLHKGGNRSGLLTKSLVCISDTSRQSCSFSLNATEYSQLCNPQGFCFCCPFVDTIVLSKQLWLACFWNLLCQLCLNLHSFTAHLSIFPTCSFSLQSNPAWSYWSRLMVFLFCPRQLNNFDFTATEKVAEWVVY